MSVDAATGGCHYFLTKKRRYCRFQPKEGDQYCPEHACMMGIHGKRKRIPCPLNPSHNCYEDDLEKHVKKCNVTKIRNATQEASYYVRSINRGLMKTHSAKFPQENKKVCVKDLTSADLAGMITRVNKLYKDHVEKVEIVMLEHPCVKEEYCGSEEKNLGKALEERAALRKELLQQASLVGQLDELGLLSCGHCFVEMGAGKGKLSHWIQKASKNCANNSFLLIERSSVRYKMDSFHKQGGAESEFKRIKIDIEDLCLGCVDMVNSNKPVVVVGKHLCGGATDMGIRCAVETLGIQKISQDFLSSRSGSSDLSKPALNNSEHQNTHSWAQNLETSLSEKMSPRLEISENVANKNRSPAASVNVLEVNTSYTADEDVEVNHSDLQHSSSDNKSYDHSPKGVSDDLKQQKKFAGNEGRTACSLGDTVVLCKDSNGFMQQDILAANEDISTHKDVMKDAKRKECDPADLENVQEPPAKTPKVADSECRQKLPKCIMIALCCHHTCTWDTYLGQEFMRGCGVSPEEFDLLTRLSSWATCAKVTAKSIKNSQNNEKSSGHKKPAGQEDKKTGPEDHNRNALVETDIKAEAHRTSDLIDLEASKTLREQLSVPDREDIGRKCKRLIDTGRLHFLRSKGMACFLRRYISEEFTPENVVLIAHLPNS